MPLVTLTPRSYQIHGESLAPVELPEGIKSGKKGDTQRTLHVINSLLQLQKERSIDHGDSHGKDNPNRFKTACVMKFTDGSYAVAANMQLSAQANSRNCAEIETLKARLQHPVGEQPKLAELWFVGGKDNDAMGKRVSVCASCLPVLAQYIENENVPVHLLPFNRVHENPTTVKLREVDGTKTSDLSTLELTNKSVLTVAFKQLFPFQEVAYAHKGIQQLYHKGLHSLKDQHSKAAVANALHAGAVDILTEAETNATRNNDHYGFLKLLQKRMWNSIRNASVKHADLEDATIAVVRNAKGEYFVGMAMTGPTIPGMAAATAVALQNSGADQNITDIFIMHADMESLKATHADTHIPFPANENSAESSDTLHLPIPMDETGHRVIRWSSSIDTKGEMIGFDGSPRFKKSGAVMHFLLPLHPDDFEPNLDMQSHDIREIFPNGFNGARAGCGGSMSMTC